MLGKLLNIRSVYSILSGQGFGDEGHLILAQWYEEAQECRVLIKLNIDERFHVASCRSGNGWVRATPLSWKKWLTKPWLWLFAAGRRLHMKISPRWTICIVFRKARADSRGEHQVVCSNRACLIIRHKAIKDRPRQEIENTGYTVEVERNAGSDDKTKPGGLKVLL